MLVSCLAYFLNLKMEVIYPSETSVDFHWATRHYIPEERTHQDVTLITILRNVTPCIVVEVKHNALVALFAVRFIAVACQVFDPVDVGSTFLRNIDELLPDYNPSQIPVVHARHCQLFEKLKSIIGILKVQ
jgi:hypothetical protein